jgi:pectate lyase
MGFISLNSSGRIRYAFGCVATLVGSGMSGVGCSEDGSTAPTNESINGGASSERAGAAGSAAGTPAHGGNAGAPAAGDAGTSAGALPGVGGAALGGAGPELGGASGGGNSGKGGAVGGAAGSAGGSAGGGGNAGEGGADLLGGRAGEGNAGAGGSGASAGNPSTGASTPIGFATLNGGTTGGLGGQTVTASSYADLKSYAESSDAYVILIEGTISNGPDGGKISVKSNKSLIGVGNAAFLDGVGIEINNSNNVVVRNLRVSLTGVTTRTDKAGVYSSTGDEGMPQILVNGGDAISIAGTSKNIWIDHCEIFAEDPDAQPNKDLYDGLIDIKGQTGFITISFCYFHDQHKGGLVGASDSDVFADRKITFHHNHYDQVKLRVPMYRGSVGHFFNNYVVGATDATEIRADTCLRVEKNYYEPLHYSIYTTSDAPGRSERIDNIEVDRSSRDYPDDCSADIPYDYSSVLTESTADVKTLVPSAAGVGKI